MRVVTTGWELVEWSAEIPCEGRDGDGCGAILEVEKEDLFLARVKDRGSDGKGFDYPEPAFRCPACNVETPASRIPKELGRAFVSRAYLRAEQG